MSVARLLCLSLLVVGLAGRLPAQEAQPVTPQPLTIELVDGRVLVGLVDGATSDTELVLRFERGGASLKRHIRWARIRLASLAGQPVDLSALPEVAQGLATKRVVTIAPFPVPGPDRFAVAEFARIRNENESLLLPAVTTMTFDAHIANWNADALTDGLVVEVYPLDGDGNLIPVRGTIEVEVFASQRRDFQYAPQSGGDTFELLERWTRSVEPADFGPSGVRVRLPFGAIHPELRSDWLAWPLGLVHVRLVVPGAGVFDDSRDAVRVRPWAPNRDYLEMNTGRRFLPTERLGRQN